MLFETSSHTEVLMLALVVLETSLDPVLDCQHVLEFKGK